MRISCLSSRIFVTFFELRYGALFSIYCIIPTMGAGIIQTNRLILFGLFAPVNIVWYDGNNFCNSLAQKEWDFPLFSVVLYCFLILFGGSLLFHRTKLEPPADATDFVVKLNYLIWEQIRRGVFD